jgi:putative DNA primase/helicase
MPTMEELDQELAQILNDGGRPVAEPATAKEESTPQGRNDAQDQGTTPDVAAPAPRSFVEWLPLQFKRGDPIGDLARDMREDDQLPKHAGFAEMREYLEKRGVSSSLLEILETAHELYQDQLPAKVETDDRFTDARLAERVAVEVMADRYIWVPGLKWMAWDGRRWVTAEEKIVRDAVSDWVVAQFKDTVAKSGKIDKDEVQGWMFAQSRNRLSAITDLASAKVLVTADKLDADPDLLNTPGGVVDMRTGQVQAHAPGLLMTGLTRGSYIPGYRHRDWDQALEAVPEDVRDWFQVRSGQAATGHPVPDDTMLVFQGSGANGKTTVTSGGPVVALGDYGNVASHKLFTKGTEHSTERADLRGRRYLVAEELTEGRSIDITALKQIIGTTRIKARFLYQDNVEFDASHTLFVTTNYVPIVNEVDHGTWRRLALVRFPYTFRPEGEELAGEHDKPGDLGLRDRVRLGEDGQHDAIVTWLVDGAIRWNADKVRSLIVPERVKDDTRAWQRDADRILGAWDELLVPDRDTAIVKDELRNVFNRWLEENGHRGWSKETFHPRFTQHAETAKHRVVMAHPRTLAKTLSRPPRVLDQVNPLPARPRVYDGVRFRTDQDDDPGSGTGGTTGQETSPEHTHGEGFQGGCSTCATAVTDPFLT